MEKPEISEVNNTVLWTTVLVETVLLDGTIVTRPQPLQIVNAYKPPSLKFRDATLPQLQHPCILAGDFNVHSIEWGYREDDEEGKHLSNWSTSNDPSPVVQPKGTAVLPLSKMPPRQQPGPRFLQHHYAIGAAAKDPGQISKISTSAIGHSPCSNHPMQQSKPSGRRARISGKRTGNSLEMTSTKKYQTCRK